MPSRRQISQIVENGERGYGRRAFTSADRVKLASKIFDILSAANEGTGELEIDSRWDESGPLDVSANRRHLQSCETCGSEYAHLLSEIRDLVHLPEDLAYQLLCDDYIEVMAPRDRKYEKRLANQASQILP